MSRAQMHFEVDHELKAHWKAFFVHMPRKSETQILTELMRNFLARARTQYTESTNKEEESNDPGTLGVDQQSNREGVHDEPGVEVPGSNARVGAWGYPLSEDAGE